MPGDRQQPRVNARPKNALVGLALFAPAIKPLAAAERMGGKLDGLAGRARQPVMRADRAASVARFARLEARARPHVVALQRERRGQCFRTAPALRLSRNHLSAADTVSDESANRLPLLFQGPRQTATQARGEG